MESCLCTSVKGTQPAVTRDEYGVFDPNLIENIKVVKFINVDDRHQSQTVPRVNWPIWVQRLNDHLEHTSKLQRQKPATPPPALKRNPWNEFQHQNGGRGWSRQRMSEEYAHS